MDNERVTVRGLPTEKPGIAVGAAVQLSPIWHTIGSVPAAWHSTRSERQRAHVKPLELKTGGATSAVQCGIRNCRTGGPIATERERAQRIAGGTLFRPPCFLINSADQKNEEMTLMIPITSPLLAGGEILLGFSLLVFVGALIARFGDRLRVGRH
jgi:hypothetical protein